MPSNTMHHTGEYFLPCTKNMPVDFIRFTGSIDREHDLRSETRAKHGTIEKLSQKYVLPIRKYSYGVLTGRPGRHAKCTTALAMSRCMVLQCRVQRSHMGGEPSWNLTALHLELTGALHNGMCFALTARFDTLL